LFGACLNNLDSSSMADRILPVQLNSTMYDLLNCGSNLTVPTSVVSYLNLNGYPSFTATGCMCGMPGDKNACHESGFNRGFTFPVDRVALFHSTEAVGALFFILSDLPYVLFGAFALYKAKGFCSKLWRFSFVGKPFVSIAESQQGRRYFMQRLPASYLHSAPFSITTLQKDKQDMFACGTCQVMPFFFLLAMAFSWYDFALDICYSAITGDVSDTTDVLLSYWKARMFVKLSLMTYEAAVLLCRGGLFEDGLRNGVESACKQAQLFRTRCASDYSNWCCLGLGYCVSWISLLPLILFILIFTMPFVMLWFWVYYFVEVWPTRERWMFSKRFEEEFQIDLWAVPVCSVLVIALKVLGECIMHMSCCERCHRGDHDDIDIADEGSFVVLHDAQVQ
jgi:hypothetical protein